MPRTTTGDPGGNISTTDSVTRERILREASELFARKGYAGTTTRDIAFAVGIRQPSLFHHFAAKSAILKQLIEIDLSAALAAIGRIRRAAAWPAAQLYRFLVFDTTHLVTSPYNLSGLYANGQLNEVEFIDQRRMERSLYGEVQQLIQAGIDAGTFAPIDVVTASEIIFALDQHTMRLARSPRLGDVQAFATDSARFVLRGLLAESSDLARIVAEASEIPMPQGAPAPVTVWR